MQAGVEKVENSLSYNAYKNSPYRSDKHSTYFGVYDDLFKKYIGKEIKFVEIGVLNGGSLFMWRSFFGNQARIIGIDLNENAKKWEEDGFEIYIGSQSDEGFWQGFISKIGPVDVVLDDGGHAYDQQIITTEMLLSNINDGGMLVVEDTHTSYLDGFGPKQYSFIEYTKKVIDRINHRSGRVLGKNSEKRIWSVRIYESIVAFLVNSEEVMLKSESVVNEGVDGRAEDFRYHDKKISFFFDNLPKRFKILKVIFGRAVFRNLTSYFMKMEFKAKRFFVD